jgi:hypothetical protein
MANTYVDYTAVASQTDYNFSFEYLRDEHVKVKVNGTLVTNYTIVTSPTPTKIRFNTAPVAGSAIKIYRDSRGDFSPLVDFVNGSVLTESELDESYKHNLFVSQEASEGQGGEQLTKKGLPNYDAEGNKIINLGTPTDATDAANKAYTDQTVDAAIALGGSPAIVSLGGYDVTALGSTRARSLADRFGEVLTPYDFGAVGDGTTDDTTALQAWIAYLNADAKNVGELGKGVFAFNTTLELTRTGVGIMGSHLKGRRTGSTRLASTLVWTGGADPMFRVSTAQHTFAYVGIESNGNATDFLELNAGHIDLVMNNVFFHGGGLFTRSVIRSNGHRLGYSSFNEVHCSSRTADKFIDIDGQGTSNGITPIEFTRCTFIGSSSSGSLGTNPWTILHVKDERIETVSFERCTFIGRDGVIVVDTTDTPLTQVIRSLRVVNCEIDEFSTSVSSGRMFKLENCHNISFSNNIITGLTNATDTALCSLINSNVSRFESNWIESLPYVFDNDSNSKINGIGINYSDWSSVQGIMLNATNWYIDVTQANFAELDGAYLTPNTSGNFICEVTSDTAYGFNLDKSKPQNWEAGQLFYLSIKNTSGGAVSANPTFSSSTFEVQSSTITTPSDGHQVTILFRFDGTKAIQISQVSPEVNNA